MAYKFVCTILFALAFFATRAFNFEKSINNLPDIVSVTKIDQNEFFSEAYEIFIQQPLDHSNPDYGYFNQRVILSIYQQDAPIIFVTEGYQADRGLNKNHINELSTLIKANQLIVEHRYFSKSKPDTLDWDYLTVESSAHDLHHIYQTFSKLFTQSKWVSTGISKGGQTTLCYKSFYPTDMNAWIAYVAPLNFTKYDRRINRFLEKVGPQEIREDITEFQREILKRRSVMEGKLDSLVKEKEYKSLLSNSALLDYCVFEYEFSFWQWGHYKKDIPDASSSDQKLFMHLIDIAGPDYFSTISHNNYQSFFVQAAKEMGYYTYDFKPLKKYTNVKNTNNYVNKVMLPGIDDFKFETSTTRTVGKNLKKDSKHVILLYGEYDPWSATHAVPGEGALKIIKPEGDHRTRINNLPEDQKAEVYQTIENWLDINIEEPKE